MIWQVFFRKADSRFEISVEKLNVKMGGPADFKPTGPQATNGLPVKWAGATAGERQPQRTGHR
jgi:hypothetical protein